MSALTLACSTGFCTVGDKSLACSTGFCTTGDKSLACRTGLACTTGDFSRGFVLGDCILCGDERVGDCLEPRDTVAGVLRGVRSMALLTVAISGAS